MGAAGFLGLVLSESRLVGMILRQLPRAYEAPSPGLMSKHLYGQLPVQLGVNPINGEGVPARGRLTGRSFTTRLALSRADQFPHFVDNLPAQLPRTAPVVKDSSVVAVVTTNNEHTSAEAHFQVSGKPPDESGIRYRRKMKPPERK